MFSSSHETIKGFIERNIPASDFLNFAYTSDNTISLSPNEGKDLFKLSLASKHYFIALYLFCKVNSLQMPGSYPKPVNETGIFELLTYLAFVIGNPSTTIQLLPEVFEYMKSNMDKALLDMKIELPDARLTHKSCTVSLRAYMYTA